MNDKDRLHQMAMDRYNARYDNVVYLRATSRFSNTNGARMANRLIDDALALCGAPCYKLSGTHWGSAARTFLALFV